MPEKIKYKICKGCGNRNHPLSQQCAWCGTRLPGVASWFSIFCVTAIVLILVGLAVYSMSSGPPSTAKFRLPLPGRYAGETPPAAPTTNPPPAQTSGAGAP